jgi:PKD repeat protein
MLFAAEGWDESIPGHLKNYTMKSPLNITSMLFCTLIAGVLFTGLFAPATEATFFLPTVSAASANAGPDITVYAGESVRLDGAASTGTIANSRWTTGDGHTVDSIIKAPHAYMVPGTYTATLTVTDAAGITSTDTATVLVNAIGASAGNTITLADTGNPELNKQSLTTALNAAALNPNENEIVVPAGFVSNDTIYMPTRNKAFGTYVTVRSSRSNELPVGTRVSKADRPKMFRINAQPAGSPGGVEHSAILIAEGTNYFRFVGMDVVRTGSTTSFKNDLISVGFAGESPARPSHIMFDRVILDGNGTGTVRGIAPNGSEFSLLNSAIYDIKSIGTESKAIGMWSGKGNLAVINNYLEAASINTLIGGAYTNPENLIDGIVFRGNHSWKNPAWVISNGVGRGYGVKNLFELKSGVNVVADGNTFENNWADAQAGSSILFTIRGDGQPLHTVSNISFRNNLVKNVAGGVNILPLDYVEASTEMRNVYIENNRFLGVGGRALLLLPQSGGAGKNIHFKHNTIRMNPGAGSVIMMDGSDGMQIFIESNDFGYAGEYGIFGSGMAEGLASVEAYFSDDSTFRKNLMSFEGRSYQVSLSYALWRYPAAIFEMYFSFTGSDAYNADGTPLGHIIGTDGLVVGAGNGAILPMPSPSQTPTPVPSPTSTPPPLPSPTPSPLPSPTVTPTPSPVPTPSPSPSSTPRPRRVRPDHPHSGSGA